MFVASVIAGTLSPISVGASFGLIVGMGFNLLFWFSIAMGAWRRTSRSSTDASASGTEPG